MIHPFSTGKYRIYCSKEYHEVYKELKGVVFNEFHELFTLCVILGYKFKNRVTGNRKKQELFASDVFSTKEYSAFNTLFILESKENNYSLLKDGERAKEFIQDYADGGMEIFLKSGVMKRFVTKKDDMFTLDFSENDRLPKQVMYYVYSLYQDFQKKRDSSSSTS
jgi:hypothetical protein